MCSKSTYHTHGRCGGGAATHSLPSDLLERGKEYDRKLKRVKNIAHETAIFGNPLIRSFTGDRKNLTDPQ